MKIHKSQKLVIAYFLLVLVSTQFLYVLHCTSHLDLTNHSQQDNESDICQICVTAKNLGQNFLIQSHLSFSASCERLFFSVI